MADAGPAVELGAEGEEGEHFCYEFLFLSRLLDDGDVSGNSIFPVECLRDKSVAVIGLGAAGVGLVDD